MKVKTISKKELVKTLLEEKKRIINEINENIKVEIDKDYGKVILYENREKLSKLINSYKLR